MINTQLLKMQTLAPSTNHPNDEDANVVEIVFICNGYSLFPGNSEMHRFSSKLFEMNYIWTLEDKHSVTPQLSAMQCA